MKQIKEMYFNILDLNKDKRICETDLFNSMQSITTNSVSDLLVDDIVLILKEIDNRRIKEEKTDEIAMVKKKIMNNANYALNNKQLKQKENHIKNVKDFLKEVKVHQDRQKMIEEQELNKF